MIIVKDERIFTVLEKKMYIDMVENQLRNEETYTKIKTASTPSFVLMNRKLRQKAMNRGLINNETYEESQEKEVLMAKAIYQWGIKQRKYQLNFYENTTTSNTRSQKK